MPLPGFDGGARIRRRKADFPGQQGTSVVVWDRSHGARASRWEGRVGIFRCGRSWSSQRRASSRLDPKLRPPRGSNCISYRRCLGSELAEICQRGRTCPPEWPRPLRCHALGGSLFLVLRGRLIVTSSQPYRSSSAACTIHYLGIYLIADPSWLPQFCRRLPPSTGVDDDTGRLLGTARVIMDRKGFQARLGLGSSLRCAQEYNRRAKTALKPPRSSPGSKHLTSSSIPPPSSIHRAMSRPIPKVRISVTSLRLYC